MTFSAIWPAAVMGFPHPAAEWAGAALILCALPFSARCFFHALNLYRHVRKSKRNGEYRLLAAKDLRSEVVTLGVQILLLTSSVVLAVREEGDPDKFGILVRVGARALAAVWLGVNSMLDLRDRKKMLEYAPPGVTPPGAP